VKEANSKGREAESNAIRNMSFHYNSKYQGQKIKFAYTNRKEMEIYPRTIMS